MSLREPDDSRPPTLTEYALVLLVMGTVGLVGVPRKPEADAVGPRPTLVRALGLLRYAVDAYEADHGDYPGFDVTTGRLSEAALVRQVTERTGPLGRSALRPWTSPHGPYLWEIPTNPVNRLATVRIVDDHAPFPDAPDDSTGWVYQPSTGWLRANASGRLPGTNERIYDL